MSARCCCLPDGVRAIAATRFADVDEAVLAPLFALPRGDVDLLLFGCGPSLQPVPAALRRRLLDAGVRCDPDEHRQCRADLQHFAGRKAPRRRAVDRGGLERGRRGRRLRGLTVRRQAPLPPDLVDCICFEYAEIPRGACLGRRDSRYCGSGLTKSCMRARLWKIPYLRVAGCRGEELACLDSWKSPPHPSRAKARRKTGVFRRPLARATFSRKGRRPSPFCDVAALHVFRNDERALLDEGFFA